MKSLFLLFAFLFFGLVSEQSLFAQPCTPTSEIKAKFCPDSTQCPCTPSKECYTQIIAADPTYTIISFKFFANELAGSEDAEECEVTGSKISSGKALSMYSRILPGTELYFYCIKARSPNGVVQVLQPVSVTVKGR